MFQELRAALCIFGLLMAVTGFGYPLAMTALGQSLFPYQANGSPVVEDGRVRGSELIGREFSGPGYFHARPSAAGAGYDAARSGATNLAPTSPALARTVAQRIGDLRGADDARSVPVDLVTASGSGLDPDISPAGAEFQAPRVAEARHMTLPRIQALIDRNTAPRQWGVFGEARVNVAGLNHALDALAPATP